MREAKKRKTETLMELSLDLSLAFVPKTVSLFLGDVSRSSDASQKLAMLEDFVQRLEDEMRKVEAFKRELPLCMLLVNDGVCLSLCGFLFSSNSTFCYIIIVIFFC